MVPKASPRGPQPSRVFCPPGKETSGWPENLLMVLCSTCVRPVEDQPLKCFCLCGKIEEMNSGRWVEIFWIIFLSSAQTLRRLEASKHQILVITSFCDLVLHVMPSCHSFFTTLSSLSSVSSTTTPPSTFVHRNSFLQCCHNNRLPPRVTISSGEGTA